MKKLTAALLCTLLFVLPLTACGSGNSDKKTLDKDKAVANLDALTIEEDGKTAPLFSNMMDMDETAAAVYNVDTSLLSDYTIRMPMMNVKACLYVIAKPAEGKEEEAKTMLDAFMTSYEAQWERYLPSQYELVKNRKTGKVGDYYVYIISEDNNAAWNAVESALS